jgi:hypothetical protein
MIRFTIAALTTGILFGAMDGLVNGNPWAVKLLECYKPIARTEINVSAGILIDFFYGFAIAGFYYFLLPVLPAGNPFIKGIIFGIGIWFFRVLMHVASSWVMFNIPVRTLIYLLISGLIEMMLLGMVNGLIIKR